MCIIIAERTCHFVGCFHNVLKLWHNSQLHTTRLILQHTARLTHKHRILVKRHVSQFHCFTLHFKIKVTTLSILPQCCDDIVDGCLKLFLFGSVYGSITRFWYITLGQLILVVRKLVFGVSDLVPHKSGYTITEYG